jgi:hypothetical protein
METCVGPGCGRSERLINGTHCPGHYRQQKLGRPLTPLRRYGIGPDPCSFEDCGRPANSHGLCNPHGKQRAKGQPLRALAAKGAGHVNAHGYRLISRPGHPNAYGNGKILEHRWVMAEHLGRPLLPTEDVHHRYGDRADNAIENLELWVYRRQPRGQRVADLLADARSIIAEYGQLEERGLT